jgi:hypothetical protein
MPGLISKMNLSITVDPTPITCKITGVTVKANPSVGERLST